nr:stage II sporulation protein M [Staphylococcus chromogenes]
MVVGFLIGILLYYFLGVDLGKAVISEDLNVKDLFVHNLTYFIIAVFGFLSLGILNVVMIFLNSAIIGFFIAHGIKSGQTIKVILALAPHSVFEIGALLIASTFSLGYISYLYNKFIKKREIKTKIYRDFVLVILLVLILTLVAALIEKYVNLI